MKKRNIESAFSSIQKNGTKPMLVPKPSDWKEKETVIVCLLPPLFKEFPQMWKYALGIPFVGNDYIFMYSGLPFNEESLQFVNLTLVTLTKNSIDDPLCKEMANVLELTKPKTTQRLLTKVKSTMTCFRKCF